MIKLLDTGVVILHVEVRRGGIEIERLYLLTVLEVSICQDQLSHSKQSDLSRQVKVWLPWVNVKQVDLLLGASQDLVDQARRERGLS